MEASGHFLPSLGRTGEPWEQDSSITSQSPGATQPAGDTEKCLWVSLLVAFHICKMSIASSEKIILFLIAVVFFITSRKRPQFEQQLCSICAFPLFKIEVGPQA